MRRLSIGWMGRLVPARRSGVSTATGTAQQGASDGQWRHYQGDTGATRYSNLDQITAENVGHRKVAWRWSSANFGPTPEFKNETTP